MAQYRAIFNNAYFKGLASAAIVTVAMAAGQAQAADVKSDFETFLTSATDAEHRAGDFTINAGDTATTEKGGYLTNLTITGKGAALTFSGAGKADHLHVSNTVSVTSGGTLTLGDNTWGIVNSEGKGDQEKWEINPQSKLLVNDGTVSITKSQIQLSSIDLTDATVTIQTNHENAADTTGWADNAMLNASTVEQNGEIVKGTGVFNVKGAKSAITLDTGSILNALVFNFEDGKITMQGTSDADTNAVIRAFGNGSVNFDGTDLAVSQSGNYIGGSVVNFNKSGTTVEIADNGELHISGALNKGEKKDQKISAAQQAGTINFKDGTLTLKGAGSKLIIDNKDTVFNATGGTINNSGTITFNNKTVNSTAALFKQMIAGNVGFAATEASTLTLTDDSVNLSSAEGAVGLLDADGAFNAKVTATNGLTVKAKEVVLGKALAQDGLTIESGVLKVTPSADAQSFTQTSGSLVALNGFASATDTNVKKFIVSADSKAISLTLGQNASSQGSVTKIDEIEVKATSTNVGTLNINGKWSLKDTALTVGASGAAVLKNANVTELKSLTTTDTGTVSLDASSLKVTGAVSTVAEKVSLANNSTLTVKHGEAFKESQKLNKVTADGTSTLVLSDYSGKNITLDALNTEKGKYLGATGLIKITDANGNQVAVSGETGITPEGTVTVDKALAGAGLADIYDKATVTGVTAAVTNSNDWGAAQLADGKTELDIGAAGTVTLNGVGNADTALVSKKGANNTYEAADVKLSDATATLNVQGNGGTLNKITADTNENGKVLVGATLNVKEDIGANGTSVAELNVQNKGTVNAANVYTKDLNVDGTLNASGDVVVGNANNIADISGVLNAGGNVTVGASGTEISGQVIALGEGKSFKSAGDVAITGSLKATDLTLTAAKDVSVGDADNTGFLEVQTLTLADGMLLLDPSFKQPTTFAAVTGKDLETNDAISVGGDIGVGMNSVLAIGTTADNAKALVSRLGYMNGQALNEKTGAVLVADNVISIADGKKVLLDPTKTKDELKTDLGSATADTFTVAKGGALVVTEALTKKSLAGTAIIEFASGKVANAKVDFAAGSTLQFDTGLTAKDTIKLTNASSEANITLAGDIIAANGLLSGSEDTANAGVIKFELKKDEARKKLTAQSKPVQELTLNALNGDYDKSEIGVDYILLNAGHNGGKSIEGTANLALYGGVVQGTSLAQQAANDAVVERMNRSNPNGSLVFANNAQGGGLWLSPVYKSHESDSFDADGVDYGVDGDLTGLVLGADSTSESGVRVGGYFNFGSASFDGQGVGDQVSNDADYFGFGLYAGMTAGQFRLLADAGFTQVSNDIEQNTDSSKYSKVTADVDSTAVTLGLRGEYKLNVATMDVTPHLGVRYTRLAIDSYDAKVNGKVLATSDFDTMQMFSIPFGVTVSKDIAAGAWTIKPVFDLTLTANAGDTDAKLNTTFIGANAVDLTSEAFDSFTYGATFGLDAKYGESFSIGLNTNYTGSSNADEFGVMGNARYMF